MKRILISKTGKRYVVADCSHDYHCSDGFILARDLQKPPGSIVFTNTGVSFVLLEPTFLDLYSKIKRKAQTIPLKDLGMILAYTGVGKESTVVEAGTGSG
ncbi:MAG: tRNA methyltransferase, partial [Candidatus Woesearchaeota archaeon]